MNARVRLIFGARFVSAVHVPKFAQSTLISGGGDPELKFWDWFSGEHLGDVPILQTVEPFIAVRPVKGRAGYSEDDDEDGEEAKADKPKGKGKKGTRDLPTTIPCCLERPRISHPVAHPVTT